MTYSIIGICVVVYVAELVSPAVVRNFAFVPVVGAHEPWRALTAAFLHSPQMFLHIVFNMLALWQIGPYLERTARPAAVPRDLPRLRRRRVGRVPACSPRRRRPPTRSASWFTAVVGASGAVFGLFGALLVLNRHLGRSSAGIGIMILINAAFGFFYPGIAWQAHLGGFVTGLACAGIVALLNKQHLRRYAVLGMLGVLVVVIAAWRQVRHGPAPARSLKVTQPSARVVTTVHRTALLMAVVIGLVHIRVARWTGSWWGVGLAHGVSFPPRPPRSSCVHVDRPETRPHGPVGASLVRVRAGAVRRRGAVPAGAPEVGWTRDGHSRCCGGCSATRYAVSPSQQPVSTPRTLRCCARTWGRSHLVAAAPRSKSRRADRNTASGARR